MGHAAEGSLSTSARAAAALAALPTATTPATAPSTATAAFPATVSSVAPLHRAPLSTYQASVANFPSPYTFPTHKLKTVLADPDKVPLVIVACGSYSPITYLHLRMFEMAKDWVVEDGRFELMGCYFSPVSDAYNKPGLASWHHRVAMCERGVAQSSDIMVDPWEASRKAYQRTTLVLDHFEYEINTVRDGVALAAHKGARESDAPSPRRRVRIMLLAGGDLIQSFAVPNLWAKADLDAILGNFGCIIIERTGSDVHDFLLSNDHLHRHRRHVFVVKQFIHNDISSTKIRLFVQRGMSIKFLLPDQVIDYIEAHALYRK